MRPEEHDETGDGLLVPMAWMYAEYVADGLLETGDLMEPTTLEYRAGRDALALTLFLSEGPVAGALPAARVDELRLLTASGAAWQRWVGSRLDARRRASAPGADPDLALARAAWRWLEETELLAADLEALGAAPRGQAGYEGEDGERRVWTPAWRLGLPLGHLAIHLY
ncbi:hypothetical protein ACIPJG_12420 [Streptomyces halstedii]|uniref:hypothetical protein n=1 Tax=Streptomyces TaxID=1883 RepID=UPI0004A8AF84|nr:MULTISPECIES: hypothetical protein [Streptomyces]KDQ71094.1 hypothetical protein DT87_28990 [Streptomyces sp. NTK 937]WSX34506.1 hypothetical protein OG291_01955 [Streptomyces halstedii]